jgi:uncharacterized protein YbjT (DUF2867 family)
MAKKVLIIGATGSIGRVLRPYLLENTDDELTLFARNTTSIRDVNLERERVLAGDVYDAAALREAVAGQDAVFVALTGDLGRMARCVIDAMDAEGVKRLVFVTSMGIYNEIPAWDAAGNLENNPVLQTYREAADAIEASDLDYTIIRPGWFYDGGVDYRVTRKGEPFAAHDVSRQSIADLTMKLIADDTRYARDSVGISD